ncbi:alpha/beta-hydrolase [Xylariaceae sp. FL0594]|nr:alpha/beta-hydrolase [Xylariaceae sp. FL0594]
MPEFTSHDTVYTHGGVAKKIHYIAAGPTDAPLIIFLHGWPGIGLTWKHQLVAFAALGFRVVAPDMPGYGVSTSRRVTSNYSQEALVEGMLALLSATGRPAAIWVAHDWGACVASSLAAHHPDGIHALVLLSIPYRSAELGLQHLVSLVDRTVYPEDVYPFGNWDYMAHYEESFETCIAKVYDPNIETLCKLLYAPTPPGTTRADASKPAFTVSIPKNGGLFGGGSAVPPPEALPTPLLAGEVFDALVQAMKKMGFWAATAYYMNHRENAAFNDSKANGARLEKPVLFVHWEYDFVCATVGTRLADPMREACSNLTEVVVDARHNVHAERPEKVNSAIARFMVERAKECWPGYADTRYGERA